MNESETRAELIDPNLKENGWDGKANPEVKVHREFQITDGKIKATGGRGKATIADYVLAFKGRKLAVVEAKSNEQEVGEGVAQAKDYACFVRSDSKIPFMAMPDAITALLQLHDAPKENLKSIVYNIGSFSPSARQIFDIVKKEFPAAEIRFSPDDKRQAIVDTWPEDVDDSAARHDWGWKPAYDEARAFYEYLIPGIRKRYTSL